MGVVPPRGGRRRRDRRRRGHRPRSGLPVRPGVFPARQLRGMAVATGRQGTGSGPRCWPPGSTGAGRGGSGRRVGPAGRRPSPGTRPTVWPPRVTSTTTPSGMVGFPTASSSPTSAEPCPPGSCTSTSTSSWPRSRSCAARSWPADPWWSAGTATRPGPGRWWRRRRTRLGRFGVRSGMPLARALRLMPRRGLPARTTIRPTRRPRRRSWRRCARCRSSSRSGAGTSAFLGADTDDPRRCARTVQARVLEDTGLSARSASARPGCRPRRRPAGPSRAAIARLTRASGSDRWATSRSPRSGDRHPDRGRGSPSSDVHTVAAAGVRRHRRAGARVRTEDRAVAHASAGWVGTTRRSSTSPTSGQGPQQGGDVPADLVDRDEMLAELDRLATRGHRVGRRRRAGRSPTWRSRSARRRSSPARRSASSPSPRPIPRSSPAKAREVFDRFDLRRPVRLLGVRVVLDEERADGAELRPGRSRARPRPGARCRPSGPAWSAKASLDGGHRLVRAGPRWHRPSGRSPTPSRR